MRGRVSPAEIFSSPDHLPVLAWEPDVSRLQGLSWKPPSRVLVRSATWSVKKTYKRLFIMGADKSNKVVVVGAGLMGTGIAHAFASSGFETVLVDTNAAALEKAYASVEKILGDGVRLGKVSEEK